MCTVIDYRRWVDDKGRAHSLEVVTLRCDGCGAPSPREVLEVGDTHWSRATIGFAVRRHGWTEQVEKRVVRNYCAACSAKRAEAHGRAG